MKRVVVRPAAGAALRVIMNPNSPVLVSPEGWLVEIAAAYQGARDAILFDPAVGESFGEAELFQLAPAVTRKFRGLPRSARRLRRATEAAVARYVASRDGNAAEFEKPQHAFAFCSLASHHGLGLLSATEAEGFRDSVERDGRSLARLINRNTKPGRPPTTTGARLLSMVGRGRARRG